MNLYQSTMRSQFSRDVLKEDFRTGLKDLDGELRFVYEQCGC